MNLSQEYKVIYMRYKHHFSPQEISSLLDMKEADVRYILTIEANECERQRVLKENYEVTEKYKKHQRKGENILITQNIELAQ